MFRACNKGFQIAFENGYTVSVMFGYRNYCSNRYDKSTLDAPEVTSESAEFVVFETDNDRYVYADTPSGGYNGGWASSEKVAAGIEAVSRAMANDNKALRDRLSLIFG
jgi:hypothetical protein